MRSTTSTTSHTREDIKQLREEVQRLGAIVRQMPAHAKEDVGNVIGFDRKELRRMARDAGRRTRRFLNNKREQAMELRDEAETRITAHPFQAVAAAVASGLLLGALLRRR